MAQPLLRSAFRNARPIRTAHDPAHFFLRSSRCQPPPTAAVTPRPSPYQRSVTHPASRRLLSTSASRPTASTSVLLNPRVDDDGADMSITISPKAAHRLQQITSTPQKRNTLAKNPITPDSHLRITVTSGGCHGFQYLMALEPAEKIDREEDTVFAAAEDAETDAKKGTAQVVMDQPSLELLKGSTVDFVTELIGSQFKIVGNPRASSSCGCGTSFDIQ